MQLIVFSRLPIILRTMENQNTVPSTAPSDCQNNLVLDNRRIGASTRVALTDEGIEYLRGSGRPTRVFLSADGFEERGIVVANYSPRIIQKLLLRGFASELELRIDDVSRDRPAVMDITKLVGYSLLYRQFDASLRDMLLDCPSVKEWNRRNPKSVIDYKFPVYSQGLQKSVNSKTSSLAVIRQSILQPLLLDLTSKSGVSESERDMQKWILEKYLSELSPLCAFLLLLHESPEQHREVYRKTRSLLSKYLEKAVLPEYLALLLLEILQVLREKNDNGCSEEQTQRYLVFRIRRRDNMKGDRSKLHVSVCSNGKSYNEMRGTINEKTAVAVRKKSLRDFYVHPNETDESGNELGLYYLSFMHERCRELNVAFHSYVHRANHGNGALLNFVLSL